MIFKLSIVVEDEDGNSIDGFTPTSSTELEEKLEELHQQNVVVQQEWLHVVTLIVKVPPHENKALKELGPEAFEEFSDEMPALVSFEEVTESPDLIHSLEVDPIREEIDYDSTES